MLEKYKYPQDVCTSTCICWHVAESVGAAMLSSICLYHSSPANGKQATIGNYWNYTKINLTATKI